MFLLNPGVLNPAGDQSDSSKQRIIFAQSPGNYPATSYYYK